MRSKLVLLSSLLISSIASLGQNASNHSVSSSAKHEIVMFDIILEENSRLEEGFVNVDKRTKSLHIDIKGSLKEGRFKIQMYDPKGKKWKKDFIVDSRYEDEVFEFTANKDAPVYLGPVPDSIRDSKQPTFVFFGRLGIAINRPKSGQWKVKIVSEKAIGKVQVSYYCRQ